MEIKENSVLVIHHFDSTFNAGLDNFKTNLDKLCNQLSDFIVENALDDAGNNSGKISSVILTTFEDFELNDEEQHRLKNVVEKLGIPFEHKVYAYGWCRDLDEDGDCYSYPKDREGIDWIPATRPYYEKEDNNVLEIDDWQRELKGRNVIITGAFVDECLDDMETVLKHCGADARLYEPLCVGSYQEYEMKHHINEFDFIDKMDEIDSYLSENDIYELEDIIEIIEEDGDLSIVDDLKEMFTEFDTVFNDSKDPFKDIYDFGDFGFNFHERMGLEAGSMADEFDRFLVENNIIKPKAPSISELLEKKALTNNLTEQNETQEVERPKLRNNKLAL